MLYATMCVRVRAARVSQCALNINEFVWTSFCFFLFFHSGFSAFSLIQYFLHTYTRAPSYDRNSLCSDNVWWMYQFSFVGSSLYFTSKWSNIFQICLSSFVHDDVLRFAIEHTEMILLRRKWIRTELPQTLMLVCSEWKQRRRYIARMVVRYR